MTLTKVSADQPAFYWLLLRIDVTTALSVVSSVSGELYLLYGLELELLEAPNHY